MTSVLQNSTHFLLPPSPAPPPLKIIIIKRIKQNGPHKMTPVGLTRTDIDISTKYSEVWRLVRV